MLDGFYFFRQKLQGGLKRKVNINITMLVLQPWNSGALAPNLVQMLKRDHFEWNENLTYAR